MTLLARSLVMSMTKKERSKKHGKNYLFLIILYTFAKDFTAYGSYILRKSTRGTV